MTEHKDKPLDLNFTPGPWQVERTDSNKIPVFKITAGPLSSFRKTVADIDGLSPYSLIPIDQAHPNAILIAKAPEMITLIKELYDQLAQKKDDGRLGSRELIIFERCCQILYPKS